MKKQQQTLWLALGLLVAGVASQARAQEVNEREYRVVVEEAEGAKTEHRSVKIKVEEENDGYRVTGTRELED
ncbi:MAG TPA: hypothetical protein DCP28_27245, partial [Cytophagales bacterium]|nr:hypothetical protein [Cytophagales bacterium]